ncbi:MAG: hypothetical protein ACK4M7_05730 [Burkholderiales bacterium]
MDKFLDPTIYIQTNLSNIVKFNPVIRFKSTSDNNHFAIILQYVTKNGSNVWEAVFGEISDGKLVELRSIYDLNETKKHIIYRTN